MQDRKEKMKGATNTSQCHSSGLWLFFLLYYSVLPLCRENHKQHQCFPLIFTLMLAQLLPSEADGTEWNNSLFIRQVSEQLQKWVAKAERSFPSEFLHLNLLLVLYEILNNRQTRSFFTELFITLRFCDDKSKIKTKQKVSRKVYMRFITINLEIYILKI